jgi:hypothetical protein
MFFMSYMGLLEEIPEGDYVEAQLLTDPVSQMEMKTLGNLVEFCTGRHLWKWKIVM